MRPTLAFDIETIPDAAGLRTLFALPDRLSDAEVVTFYQQKRRARTDSDFLPLHVHRVVAISCCLRWQDKIHIASIGAIDDDEAALVRKFYALIDTYTPQLVSWNGGGFDLPVLHYRALIHALSAPRYWDSGDGDFEDSRTFRYNNYLSRYHMRHCDLMDVLSLYQARAAAPLDDMAKLCGFPGKLGMDGGQVWDAWQNNGLERIRAYCETDAANTYLMFLRFELMRGVLNAESYQMEIQRAREYVQGQNAEHWREFYAAWR